MSASEKRAPSATRTPGPKMPCSIEKRTSSRPPSASERPPAHTAQRVPSSSSSEVPADAGAGAGAATSGTEGGATADGGSGWGVTASAAATGATATGASGTGATEGGACGCRRRSSSASSSRLNRVRRPLSWSCSDATPLRALRARNKAMKPTRMTRNSMPTVPRLHASRALLLPWPDHGTARSAERKSGLLASCTELWPAREGSSQEVNGARPDRRGRAVEVATVALPDPGSILDSVTGRAAA